MRKPYTFRFDEDLMEKELRPMAKADHREFTNFLENIFINFVKKNNERNPKNKKKK